MDITWEDTGAWVRNRRCTSRDAGSKKGKTGSRIRTKTGGKDDKPKLDEETNSGRAEKVAQHHLHIETREMTAHFPGLAFVSPPEMQVFEPSPPALKDKYPSFFRKGLNLSKGKT